MLGPRQFFFTASSGREQSLVRCPGKPSGPGHQRAHHAATSNGPKTNNYLHVPNVPPGRCSNLGWFTAIQHGIAMGLTQALAVREASRFYTTGPLSAPYSNPSKK